MQTVFTALLLLTLLPLIATVIGGFFLYGYARLHLPFQTTRVSNDRIATQIAI